MSDYYRYWGKAGGEEGQEPACHLLPYHCLDVAAVAEVWWQRSQVLQDRFTKLSGSSPEKTRAWLLFFIALHDLGKIDVRFQMKAREIACALWPEFRNADPSQSSKYWHGDYSAYWVRKDLSPRFQWDDDFGDDEKWEAWSPWIYAVAGHHGVVSEHIYGGSNPRADALVIEQDRLARLAYIEEIERLFLSPAGLSLDDDLPGCDQDFLAGFCSICDWLGSAEVNAEGEKRFFYVDERMPLDSYFTSRIPIAEKVFDESGLLARIRSAGGMLELFPDKSPRLIQLLVDDLPVSQGLTIIEAPTGVGKTEAALAYASRLLAAGVAESVIFALPTQATANAMFDRLQAVTSTLFGNANLLLAHGKAGFNEQFINLKKAASHRSPQDQNHETEAQVQCSQWLGQSRKRVFLGQVGVCTIDQVLISVLPVRHKFVRSFGLGKSILIVDEVHAYDSYMYGLLQDVLRRQQKMQGSAILLTATLPSCQKRDLVDAWGGVFDEQAGEIAYPLISHCTEGSTSAFELSEAEKVALRKSARFVYVDVVESPGMRFDDALLQRVIRAAEVGANVVLICNLVADAQATARRLIGLGADDVELFHSRFRFRDRQAKEKGVLTGYGNGSSRNAGGILVATQVVEQSLDLDFDWMLTQLCPVDLFFQRLGRLHRHERPRPTGFEQTRCSVIVPVNHDYELHKVIYGSGEAPNSRVLWRTEQLLRQHTDLKFPDVYRPMIEQVYQQEPWLDEPDSIQAEFERFEQTQVAARATAWHLVRSSPNFEDSDSKAALLTRDGEMSLNVIPVTESDGKRKLLDGMAVNAIEEWRMAETLSMNTVPVPASWRKFLPQEREGLIWLPMQHANGEWLYANGNAQLIYSIENGLERRET